MQLERVKNSQGTMDDNSRSKVLLDDPLDVVRREKVKEAMLHAWTSYEKYAWGQDELQVLLIDICIFHWYSDCCGISCFKHLVWSSNGLFSNQIFFRYC